MQILIFFLNSRFGRCESLNDMWIAGEFDIKQIKCNFFAKAQVEKLAMKAKTTREAAFFASDEYTYVTFFNARSLRKHHEDISNDEEVMKSKVIGIAETHLYEDETVGLEGFEAHTVNAGKGKGVAAFSKIHAMNIVKIKKESYSAVFLSFKNVNIVFAYLSKGVNMNDINTYMVPLLQKRSKPTIVMADMNYHYLEEKNSLKSLFAKEGYVQLIDKVTHDEGHVIDHLYVSSPELLSKDNIYLKPLYFSDHDAICIRLSMDKYFML